MRSSFSRLAGCLVALVSVLSLTGSARAEEVTVTLPGGVPLVMVRIPAGTFQMGSPSTERGRGIETLHQVTLTSDYFMGKYEVTQAQWQAVMGTNPSNWRSCGGTCPVEQVSWNDIRGANGFLDKLNAHLQATGQTGAGRFRLPTEAEWERAARGGTQTRFSFGDALDGDDGCGTNATANLYAWWCGNSATATHPVGTKTPNAYGLYDVHGNVFELVEDWFGSYPSTPVTDPTGPPSGNSKIIRGGGIDTSGLRRARSADRSIGAYTTTRMPFDGFRLAMGITSGCTPNDATLCLLNGRFRITADYGDYGGNHGTGHAQSLTSDTGYFWFFNSSNVEAVVKIVSFCNGSSGNVGVYAGGLTDLGVTLHVTDTRTNQTTDYSNPLGTGFQLVRDGPFGCPAGATSGGDDLSSIVDSTLTPPPTIEPEQLASPHPLATCAADGQTLCLLSGRFQVKASYTAYSNNTGTGQAVSITPDTGYFWFFNSANVEAVIKLVPFCTGGSNTVGVYAAGLTDVGVTLTVTDTQTGLVKTCTNALGHPFDLIRDGPFVCDGGEGQEITVTLPGGVPLAMVRIPAGTFQMGSAQTERGHWDNEAQHTVALTQDFYVGKTELTQGQWQAVMGAAMSTACGSYGMGASYPVYCVTYDEIGEAAGFVEKLNAHLTSTGQPGAGRYRLPTEAEWERAARGGVTTSRRFSFGDATNGDDSCGANAEANSYVWWCYAAGNASHPVGTKAPNPYGLYDMHGNLSEWVSDWYEAQTNAAQTNPAGPPTGTYRVIRDGPWAYNLVNCRSARRSYYFPSTPHWSIGFRLARSL